MRPLRLELEGFGPYREWQGVDFSDVELFAITGPTGSGKSTLLDAIAFALYGLVPRVGRNVASLIHPAAREARVRLTFQVGGRVYRVERVRGRRSEGRFFEVLGEGERLIPLETLDELNQKLQDLLGLSYKAFTRALLLPQGEFDRFLKGEVGERREILLDLFELGRLERVREKAAARKGALLEEKGRLEGERVALGEVSPNLREELSLRLEALRREAIRLEEEGGRLGKELEKAKALVDLLAEEAGLKARLSRLQAEEGRIAELEERLRKAEEAERALPFWKEVREKERLLSQTEREWEQAQARLRRLEEERKRLAFDPDALREAREALLEAERLLVLVRLWRRVGVKDHPAPRMGLAPEVYAKELESLLEREGELLEKEGVLSRWAEVRRGVRENQAALDRLKRELETLVEEGKGARAQVEEREGVLKGAEAYRLQVALKALEGEWNRLRGERDRLEAELARLGEEERRLGLLAYRDLLRPGEPCPLCGSPVQALPSHLHQGPGSLEAKALSEGRREMERTLKAVLTRMGALEGEMGRIREDLARLQVAPIPQDPEAVRLSLEEAKERHQELREKYREAQGRLKALEGRARDLAQEEAQWRAKAFNLGLEAQDPEALWQEVLRQLEVLREEKVALAAGLYRHLWARTGGMEPGAYQAHLAKRVRELEERERRDRELAREVEEVAQSLARLSAQLEERRRAVREARERVVGLMPEEEAQALHLSPEERAALALRIQDHRKEKEEVVTLLKDLETKVKVLWPDPLPSLEEARRRFVALEERYLGVKADLEAKRKDLTLLERELEEVEAKLGRLQELEARLAEVTREVALWEKLALDLQRDNFPAYLLGLRQRALVERADELLLTLSGGRYRLRTQGDEFQVLDLWTEAVRPVKTLSGGESFLASLSLALALSEELSRGRLGALFLDEGFGTLDPETLEVVAGVLEILPTRGRLVGIVTHVEALAERLPARLRVRKHPSGSRVEWA
ncbi:MAG: SMC family ATPase [Thermus sp.]|nr:SMC family ATPase [Thermus sp.]